MAEKASRRFHRVQNQDGAAVSTVSRALLNQDGLTFKDIDGSGTVSTVNDWRRPATEGSLENYHLPPFQVAVDCGTSSIMPYYSKPAAAKSAPTTATTRPTPCRKALPPTSWC